MAKRYQRDNQKPYIKEQTMHWPIDTKGTIRSRNSKNRQYNGQKIPTEQSEAVNKTTDND